jgi:type II secretory pathway pseudopilin PulG
MRGLARTAEAPGAAQATARERDREHGLSLIEALVALAIIFIVAIGLVPLFSRSIVSNAQGGNSTVAANFARTRLEELQQVDFNGAPLQIPAGATESVSEEHWDATSKAWLPGPPPPGGGAVWRRTTTIRQYAAADLLEDGSLDNPLPGDSDRSQVQLKRIDVQVRSQWANTLMGPFVDLRVATVRGI